MTFEEIDKHLDDFQEYMRFWVDIKCSCFTLLETKQSHGKVKYTE